MKVTLLMKVMLQTDNKLLQTDRPWKPAPYAAQGISAKYIHMNLYVPAWKMQ